MNLSINNRFSSLFYLEKEKYPNSPNLAINAKCKRNAYLPAKCFVQVMLFLIAFAILPFQSIGQVIPNEAEWNGFGYSLKKIVSNTTIESGVHFSYTIMLSAPAGVTVVNIFDKIPSNLVVVSVPTPAPVNGVIPTVDLSGPPGINEIVEYSLSGLPAGSASSGSFTIVVKFPEGVTCNGETALNYAGIETNNGWKSTPTVNTVAIAADPWIVSKSILSGPVVNPNGGYLMMPDDIVTYRLSVSKNSPYDGNVVGQQNMSSAAVTDVLPSGAVLLSSTCGIPANSTGTITWTPNSGNLNVATNAYYCDITVYYPSASFPIGSLVYNELMLDGVSCNQPVSHMSNETCIEVENFNPDPSGYLIKYIYLTNRAPGCQGYYRVIFRNSGNVPLTAFNINDVIPSGISVNRVKVFNDNGTTTMSLIVNGNPIASNIIHYDTDNGTPLTSPINDLQLQMTGSLPVGERIYMYIYFDVEPNPTGTIVTNCATFDGLSNNLSNVSLDQACPSFTVEGGPHPCVLKDVCSSQASYEPGDIVRYRLRVQNIGSVDITGASFQDILHSNFTYVGNESYYIANTYDQVCSSGGGIPAGTSAWSGVIPNHSGNNLSWTLPDIPSDCQLFYVGQCGYEGTSELPYYFVEFDVMVDNSAMPGITPNNYYISGGNLNGTVTSNTTNTLVAASFGQEVYKQVSTDNGTTFGSSATVNSGSSVRYRLSYKNTSNVTVDSVRFADLLPLDDNLNDWLVLNRAISRGSEFDVTYNSNHSTSITSGTAPTPTLSYAPGMNICLPLFGINAGCTPTTWGSTPDQNIGIDYGVFLLDPNVTLSEDFDVTIPADATNQQIACNDFAAVSTADFLLDGEAQSIALPPIAAPPICITIDPSSSSDCCDNVIIEQVFDEAAGNNCCVSVVTDCPVNTINVFVTNGKISSGSWNCDDITPADPVGLSDYTIAVEGCVLEMTNCFEPIQYGMVTVTYTIVFENEEECIKTIDLECGECCNAVQLELAQDGDLQGQCCARIITTCEVDLIEVTIDNGTFASVFWNWNNIELPAGLEDMNSYTFDIDNSLIAMITCVEPDQTGVVTITYMIDFENGEVCEKTIELWCCEAVSDDCCALVDFDLRWMWPDFYYAEVGTFSIINADPSSPICSVSITSSPAATFNTVSLIVDDNVSDEIWNSSLIPELGDLSPTAVNNMEFSLIVYQYRGVITVCVKKCDGTECCFDIIWNPEAIPDLEIAIAQLPPPGNLFAVTINPVVTTIKDDKVNIGTDDKVKYVSFGMCDEEEILAYEPEFFAISATEFQGDDYPESITAPMSAYMGKHNAFFELSQPKSAGDDLGAFNLVFSKILPKLGCALYDEEGNIIFSGDIDVSLSDTVNTSVIEPGAVYGNVFEFIKLYPNPSNGTYRVTYATGNHSSVEIRVINPLGQVIDIIQCDDNMPGIHNVDIDSYGLSRGLYHVILSSEGKVLTKSVLIKK